MKKLLKKLNTLNTESLIRNSTALSGESIIAKKPVRRNLGRIFRVSKKIRRRSVRITLLLINVGILLGTGFFILHTPDINPSVHRSAAASSQDQNASNPLDRLSSADIAVHLANVAHLEEATSVANNADTVNARLSITAADDTVLAKPQVVNSAVRSCRDVKNYVVKAGDSVNSIAVIFGITSDSIRWSNSLISDNLTVGRTLLVPTVTGVVYTVRAGDTVEKIAEKYKTTADSIIHCNDAEVTGLKTGQLITVPDGTIVPISSFAWNSFSPIYGFNGYDRGYCTWWVAVRRAQVGKPIPANLGNAISWKDLAKRAGMSTGNVPATYAVIWTPAGGGLGHVGFVESVDADGTVHVSEMNIVGWNVVSNKTLTPAQAAAYTYIY